METKTYTTMNRDGWPSGPWDGEPDKMQWQDEETGLPCLAVRNHMGVWCGYVGVDSSHPDHGKPYKDVEDYDVHGGLTFADACQLSDSEAEGICHVPEADEPDDVWWFGFDCVHLHDINPRDAVMASWRSEIPGASYKTLAFVRDECRKLAAQLAARAYSE